MTSKPHRVLVVDRTPLVQQQASEKLQHAGFVCETVGNGREAMEMLNAEPYDVVVSDLTVSNGSRRSFCLELLQADNCPKTIVITDEIQSHIAQALRKRGAADVCFKPIDYAELAETIKYLVDGSDPTSETLTAIDPATKPDSPNSTADKPEKQREQEAQKANASDDDEPTGAKIGTDISQAKCIVTILIKDKERLEELNKKLAAVDVQGVAASGSEDLLQQLNQQRIDLVIIENELGGFLTGLEIMKRLSDDLIRPESILLADPNERIKKQAADIGIKTIIDPQSDLDDIVKAIEGITSDVSQRSELIPEAARKIVQDFEGIPPLPQLILKLTRYMAMDVGDIPVKELANDISFDPKAITELLKLTNSSAMGLRRKITKVSEAVNLLGPKRTISLIVSSATISAQSQLLKKWSEDLRRWYYKRSVLVASTAATFAEKMENVSADSCFVLGLLQDIGILVFANSFGERYTPIIERVREVGQLRIHQLEEKEFKLSHPAVSAALLQKWKFPQSLVGPILNHHNYDSNSERSPVELSLIHSMQIGEALADLADLAHPVRTQALNKLLAKYGDELAGKGRQCLAESVAKAADSCKLFSLPVPDAEEMQQLVETITTSQEPG